MRQWLFVVGSIRGENPTKAEIKSRLPHIAHQVIAYKESRFLQFNKKNLPLVNQKKRPVGFGVMQLTRDPLLSARELWDWKQNVDAGVSKYEAGKRVVRKHYKNMRESHPKLPELTADQLKIASYQYYNAGNHFYWVPDDTETKWVKNPITDSGGKHPYTDYGDDAVRVEKLVVKGTPPADWD
jgi:hypothetical protein